MNLYQLLLEKEVPYSRKNVLKLLCKIKYSKNEELRRLYVEQLYFALSRIVLKNISGFFSYVKSKGVTKDKLLHDADDIATESYITLVNCTKNINLKYKDSFHFFYNTSLLRRNKRIFERQYRKHLGVLSNTDKVEYVMHNTKFSELKIDFSEIDFGHLNQMEIEIIKSKVNKEKVVDFMSRFEISNSDYKKVLDSAKSKLKEMYL